MFRNTNHLVCTITDEFSKYHNYDTYKQNALQMHNYREQFLKDIEERTRQHIEDMARLSPEYELSYNARMIEHYNKNNIKACNMLLIQVRDALSNRSHEKILSDQLKAMYDSNMNSLNEELRSVYSEIKRLDVNDNIIAYRHAIAVQNAVQQSIEHDKTRTKAYNRMQYERNRILHELLKLCILEKNQIQEIKELKYKQSVLHKQANTNFKQANTNFKQTNTNFKQANTNFKQGDSDFQQADSDFQQADSDFQQGDSDFQQSDSDFQQGDSDFQQSDSDFQQGDKQYDNSFHTAYFQQVAYSTYDSSQLVDQSMVEKNSIREKELELEIENEIDREQELKKKTSGVQKPEPKKWFDINMVD